MQKIISKIDEYSNWLKSIRPIDNKKIQIILDKFLIEYNYHSNHIEWNSLTLQETWGLIKTKLVSSDKNKKFKDYIEMNVHNKAVQYLNLVDKLFYIENFVKNNNLTISEKLLKKLNQMILVENHKKHVRDEFWNIHFVDVIVWQYKTKENNIQRISDWTIFNFASVIDTQFYINNLIQRFEKHKSIYHPLILASIFHYKFIRIHPFDDWNGRVTRLVINLILMNNGIPIVIITSDNQNRQEYYNTLELTDANFIDIENIFEDNNIEKYFYFIKFI